MLEMYVFSGGDTAQKVLNAIALFFHSDERVSMVYIISRIVVFLVALKFILSRDPNVIFGWAAGLLLITSLLIVPTSNMIIIDASERGRTYTVDNVPLGVALPAHYGTLFMHGASETIDTFFRLPDDQAYSKSGMLFGSKLMNLSTSIGVQDAELKAIWGQYLANCIRKDITINKKYTWEQFAHSGDVFTFLKNNSPSPVRRIVMNNAYVTCKDALPDIEDLFTAEADKSFSLMGTQSFGSNMAKEEALLKNALQNTMSDYGDISKSASEIMKQNIAVNAIREGLYSNAAGVDAVGAALNYSHTQNSSNIKATMIGAGLAAQEWLPIAHSVLILLILCSSVIVFLACFIPGLSLSVLKGYVGGFFYLATWPIFFTFINMIMTYELQSATGDITDVYAGMTFANTNALNETHIKMSALAGWLMMSVPIIAAKCLQGGVALGLSAMQQFTGVANGSVIRTAPTASSGDMSFGNAQIDNHSFNNQSANKHDLNYVDNMGRASSQRTDGTNVANTVGGNTVFDTGGSISQTGFNINDSNVQTQALSQNLSEQQRVTAGEQTAYNNSVSSSVDALQSLTKTAGESRNWGGGTGSAESTSFNQNVSAIDNLIKETAAATGQSESEISRQMIDNYHGWDVSAGGGLKKDFGLFSVNASGSLSKGKKDTTSEGTSSETSNSLTEREAQSRQEQFNEMYGKVQQFTSSTNTSELSSEQEQATLAFNDAYRKSDDLSERVDISQSREKSYQDALTASQSGSLSVNTNLMPEFQEYVKQQNPQNVEAIMNGSGEAIRNERDAYIKGFFAEKFDDYNPELQKAQENSHIQTSARAITGGKEEIESTYQQGSQIINAHGTAQQEGKPEEMVIENVQESQRLFDPLAYDMAKLNNDDNRQNQENEVEQLDVKQPITMPQIEPQAHKEQESNKPVDLQSTYWPMPDNTDKENPPHAPDLDLAALDRIDLSPKDPRR